MARSARPRKVESPQSQIVCLLEEKSRIEEKTWLTMVWWGVLEWGWLDSGSIATWTVTITGTATSTILQNPFIYSPLPP